MPISVFEGDDDDAKPGTIQGLVKEASRLQKSMHANLCAAFAKGVGNSSYERAMARFAQGESMGWSDLFSSGTRLDADAKKMVEEDGARLESVNEPGVRDFVDGKGWRMWVAGTKMVCDTPFVFERKDRHRHADDDDGDETEEEEKEGEEQDGASAQKERRAAKARMLEELGLGGGPNRHSNRLWVQVALDWSVEKSSKKGLADLMYMEEAAYAFALQTVMQCINTCDASFVEAVRSKGGGGKLVRRDLDGFDYAFFKEKSYKERGGRVCGTFVGLHKGHMVAAFVHKRRKGLHDSQEDDGRTMVTMDLCKIAYECCLPGSFPLSSIVEGYPAAWKDEMPEEGRCLRTRAPVWRCIVTPREMLELRREYVRGGIMATTGAAARETMLLELLLPSRNVDSLHDLHFAIDLESIRVLMRFQIAALLVKRYHMAAELAATDPFEWHAGDPKKMRAAGRKMERILEGMLRKKDIVLN